MVTFDAWIFPDGETHLPAWMTREDLRVEGRLTYQYHKYAAARALCRRRRTAVDIGAHVGLWSYWMARDFQMLHAFEPDAGHCACWAMNVQPSLSAALYPVALGDVSGTIGLEPGEPSSGNTHVSRNGSAVTVPLHMLDSFTLKHVDFLKVDCEGYEYFVLAGARDTIRRCRPVIVVEQKLGYGPRYGRGEQDAVDLLIDLGARVVVNLGWDFILTFGDANGLG